MGTQAKYYQIKENKFQNALKQLSVDEDFYSTIQNPEFVVGSIDIDTSWKSLPYVIAKSSSNIELSQLAFFGNNIETNFASECEIKYISHDDVVKIDILLKALKNYNKEEFISAFNDSQDAPYDKELYADMFSFFWAHFNSFREFFNKCKLANSSILVLIS